MWRDILLNVKFEDKFWFVQTSAIFYEWELFESALYKKYNTPHKIYKTSLINRAYFGVASTKLPLKSGHG